MSPPGELSVWGLANPKVQQSSLSAEMAPLDR